MISTNMVIKNVQKQYFQLSEKEKEQLSVYEFCHFVQANASKASTIILQVQLHIDTLLGVICTSSKLGRAAT